MIVSTQWGVESPWGTMPTEDRETAETAVKNMREAGDEAYLMWRGVTAWVPQDGMD